MTQENAQYISGLNSNYPEGAASASGGDDHLRMLKIVLHNTFPNLDGPVDATPDELSGSAFASGTKLSFYQAATPIGWTQDTSVDDHVLRAVGGDGGESGGSVGISSLSTEGHALTVSELPAHDHGGSTDGNTTADPQLLEAVGGFGSSTGVLLKDDADSTSWRSSYTRDSSNHTHSIPSEGGGSAHSHNISPKYIDVIVATKD